MSHWVICFQPDHKCLLFLLSIMSPCIPLALLLSSHTQDVSDAVTLLAQVFQHHLVSSFQWFHLGQVRKSNTCFLPSTWKVQNTFESYIHTKPHSYIFLWFHPHISGLQNALREDQRNLLVSLICKPHFILPTRVVPKWQKSSLHQQGQV